MKTAFVYFTLNAASSCDWQAALDGVGAQSFRPDLKLVADSGSDDGTVELARERGFEVYPVRREEFNHGKTRDEVLRYLEGRGFEVAVYASQDAVLEGKDSLKNLTDFLAANSLAGAYGRQLGRTEDNSLNAFQRERCYPAQSCIKSRADIPAMGLMTAFCSDAFCAWNIRELLKCGGFPETDFGEDMLAAAGVILKGGRIGYCAEACCIHEHAVSWPFLLRRGWEIGRMHGKNPWLLKEFGMAERTLKKSGMSWNIAAALAVKYAGYAAGKISAGNGAVWAAFIFLWLLLLPLIFLFDLPLRDIASRYAPMAEAFTAGEWEWVFHPRIPPLFPLISGCITWLFHCSGAMGCRIASAFMLTTAVFPLWGAVKNLHGRKIAGVTLILYCSCVYLLRLGYSGFREPASCFGIVLAYYALSLLWKNGKSVSAVIIFPCAVAIMLLTRGDGWLVAFTSCLVFLIWDLIKNKIPWRSLAVAAAVTVLISPWLYYNYTHIGYPVADVRHAAAVRMLERRLSFEFPRHPSPAMELDINMPGVEEQNNE